MLSFEGGRGKDRPFPIRLDATGEMMKRCDTSAVPTMILLAPHGRLVAYAGRDKLKQALDGKVKTPEPIQAKDDGSGTGA